jgi:hypothetical protein
MSWLLKVTHMWVTFFNKEGRLLYSFHLCHILLGIATLVILGRIIDGKKTLLARTIQRTYVVLGPYDELWVIIG